MITEYPNGLAQRASEFLQDTPTKAKIVAGLRPLAAEPAHSEPYEVAPTWAVGDRVTVFDLSDDDVEGALGFVGVECEVVQATDPAVDEGMVHVRHPNGLVSDFWPEELAVPGTPPTKRALRAIAEGYGRRPTTLPEAFDRVQAWQKKTFGDASPLPAQAEKMQDEATELAEAVRDLYHHPGDGKALDDVKNEIADVAFMLFSLLRALGFGHRDLAAFIMTKLTRNESRVWTADATGKFSGTKESK